MYVYISFYDMASVLSTYPLGVCLLFTPQGPETPLDVPLHAVVLAGCIVHALNTFM